jgi:hypothetical protein
LKDFNPYHEWLGCDPGLRQPNYYQLLGIDEQEADTGKIAAAVAVALSRAARVRAGKRQVRWTRLLEEIDAANKCLRDPVQRAEYDRRLQARRRGGSPAFVPPAPRLVSDLERALLAGRAAAPTVPVTAPVAVSTFVPRVPMSPPAALMPPLATDHPPVWGAVALPSTPAVHPANLEPIAWQPISVPTPSDPGVQRSRRRLIRASVRRRQGRSKWLAISAGAALAVAVMGILWVA